MKFRIVFYFDGLPDMISSSFPNWDLASSMLDRASGTGFCNGGHIIGLFEIAGQGPQWFLCNVKPELV